MGQFNRDKELPGVNINSLLNMHQVPSLQDLHVHGGQNQMLPSPEFDPGSSHDDFLEQMLASVPASVAAAFNWAEDHPEMGLGSLEEQQGPKTQPEQISKGAVLASRMMLQQQLLLARGIAGGTDQNGVVDGNNSFSSANGQNDASIKAMFNGFLGSLGQNSIPSQHFHHTQGGPLQQSQNFGAPAAMNQPAVSGSSSGGAAAQPRQRVRARRGQATDPHSIAERLRRERIAERMKSLQELVPNANKTDKASMLDEIIDYVKFLQLQVKVLSMSRLGGAAAVAPLIADKSREGRSVNGTQTASSSNNDGGLTVTEQQVAKLMEEDMGAAMQYLQGKGLCLMPISLATAISTATATSTSHNRHPLLNGEAGPSSPSVSALTVQSATAGNGGEVSVKDAAVAASKLE